MTRPGLLVPDELAARRDAKRYPPTAHILSAADPSGHLWLAVHLMMAELSSRARFSGRAIVRLVVA